MRKPHAYTVYLILSGASTLFNSIMFTVLTVYYVTEAHLDPLQLVLVGTIMEATCFVFQVPTGVVADTRSRRLSVIIGTFISGAAFIFVGVMPGFAAIALGLSVWGIGATFIDGAREAWIADEVGPKRLGQVLMRSAQVQKAAALAGTFISIGLASLRLNLPIVVGGGLTLLLGIYLILVMPETGFQPVSSQDRTSWHSMTRLIREGATTARRSPLLRWFLVAGVALGAYSEAFDRLGEAHFLIDYHFPAVGDLKPVVWIGLIRAGMQILGFIVTGIAARRLARSGNHPGSAVRTLTVLNLVRVGSVVGFGLAGSFSLAVVAYWSVGVVSALDDPIYTTWLNQHIEPRVRATVLSMTSQADALGQFTGGPAIGALGDAAGLPFAMVASGLLLLPVFLLYWRGMRHTRSGPLEEMQPAATET